MRWIEKSLLGLVLLVPMTQAAAEEDGSSLPPLFLESRMYAGDTPAFGANLGAESWGWLFKVGAVTTFDTTGHENSDNVDLEFGLARPFVLNDTLSMSFGAGALGSDAYADYSLDYVVSNRLTLTTGYRYNLIDESENRHQLFLGVRYALNTSTVDIPQIQENVPPDPEPEVYTQTGTVGFASNGKMPLNTAILDEFADQLSYYPGARVTIVGYADSSGSAATNLQLSDTRANAVAVYLIGKGLNPQQVQMMGMGDANPIASNATPEGRAQNRRVDITLSNQQTR